MDKVIIYISYDIFQYVNYYHLICNGEKILEYCPEEELLKLFEKIEKNTRNPQLYIVGEANVSPWDFQTYFDEKKVILKENAIEKKETIFEKLCEALNIDTDKDMKLIYSGIALFEKEEEDTEETLRQAKEIFDNGGEEKTELARIIKEKYERMNNNEYI